MSLTLARLTRFVGDLSREPDGQLLAAFLSGNQAAFRELVDRHAPLVFGVCNRILRHQQDAEDAFQAVFIVLARRAADVWPQDAVGSWLYGVASRVAFKARTLRTRRWIREQTIEEVTQPCGSTSEHDTAEAVDRAVRKLPEVYRAAVVACDLEGLSRKDAARQLGWTEGTLSGRLARARKLLADRLRKAGITFPVAGLPAVLGTDSTVRAGLLNTVLNCVSTASGVPAPVAALTQGVVQSMFAYKLKVVASAILVACTIGFGAWTVGAGDDPAGKDGPGKPTPPSTTKPQSVDLTKMRAELKLIEQELAALIEVNKVAGADPSESVKRRIQQAEARLAEFRRLMANAQEDFKAPTKPLAILDPALKQLEGRWKIESISDGKRVESADTKVELFIEIAGNTLFMPYRESDGTLKREEYKIAIDANKHPKTIDLIQLKRPGGVGKGIYEFTAPITSCTKCHASPFASPHDGLKPSIASEEPISCGPGLKVATGLHLTIAMAGPQPTKFDGAEGVLEFRLTRIGDHLLSDKNFLEQYYKNEFGTGPKATAKLDVAHQAVADAQIAEEQARAQLLVARAQVTDAQTRVARATKNLEVAQAQLLAAEKLTASQKLLSTPPGKDDASYTIHIRTQLTPEKVIRVKVTDSQSVLEGLAYAAEDMAIKADAISVWVVRNKRILTVDLAAITQKGDTATNYQLKPGDQLFVQVKVGK